MSETTIQDLRGVAETMLITLYLRAMESQRPDALIRDEKAMELVARMCYDFEQVKSLVLTLRDRFPGAELVFDAYSPIHDCRHNLQTSTSKIYLRVHWGIWHGEEIEGWGDGIRLLDEWGFFDCPEARLAHIRWMRGIEALARTLRIYHFQLGKAKV